ncbi:ankyrin repeat-containing domain protein [Talaromyces proteolyticus]|uniref:Ankyrin repeat-containing domain protein n=1 Tax=Talaromyces proteolyticus TaxID=1131652 RepID=A0AAD4L161_9EURO|nr:ankyrin repeat-containing domain protein [Talaromyces proteolyticus]KAH8703741.1 ankyrin repeat-containing domain protein [Talaromyces proteolyticus]
MSARPQPYRAGLGTSLRVNHGLESLEDHENSNIVAPSHPETIIPPTENPEVRIRSTMLSQGASESSPNDAESKTPESFVEMYTVAWICALHEELMAACRMLDEEYQGPEHPTINDHNTYTFGRIRDHYVVVGCMQMGRVGTCNAASVARDMVRSFPNLKFGLMVGIGGGAPTKKRDIRLGDVVVSVPEGTQPGVVQYDFGKRLSENCFQRTGHLNAPPNLLLGATQVLKRLHNDPKKPDSIATHIKRMDDMLDYQHPAQDSLYRTNYEHKDRQAGPENSEDDGSEDEDGCHNCGSEGLVHRKERPSGRKVYIHYGTIASGNSVMKDPKTRNYYARNSELNVLCFETEAAGLMNNLPCLVIRGISDYSDSHKNDSWKKFAALTAAAYARELLIILRPQNVCVMPSWARDMKNEIDMLQNRQEDLLRLNETVSKDVKYLRTQGMNQKHQDILEWLAEADFTNQQSDIIAKRQKGTGEWMLESNEFKQWFEQENQTLFCPGIPGAGKTVITSVVIQHLDSVFRSDPTVGIAYLYFSLQQPQQHNQTAKMMRSLLRQLVRIPTSESLMCLYGHYNSKGTSPSADEVLEVLCSVAASYSRVFIVVDALDEFQGSQEERMVFLSMMFKIQERIGANIFATSRFIKEIENEFRGAIKLMIRAHDIDVQKYIDGRLQKIPLLASKDLSLLQEIKGRVSKAAGEMFLLVKLYIDSFVDKTTIRAVKIALKDLEVKDNTPNDVGRTKALDRAYMHAMKRIDTQAEERCKLAKQILSWITFAKKPLSRLELQQALAVEVGKPELDNENIPDIEVMVSVCAGLITVDERSEHIRLVHYTAHEYFKRTWDTWLPNIESDITTVLVTYLSFENFEVGPCQTSEDLEARLQSNPLYNYAARYWGYHARAASMELDHAILFFLENNAKVAAAIQAMKATAWTLFTSDELDRIDGLAVHIAAHFGLTNTIDALLRKGFSADTPGRDIYGRRHTPLEIAASSGHKTMVKLLLSQEGTNPNREDQFGRTPLSHAAEKGYEDIVKLLLSQESDNTDPRSDSPCGRGRTPLSYAAEKGREAVIELLLSQKGINPDSKDKDGRTPLFYAAGRGSEAVVKLLLATKGVNPDSKDILKITPLLKAAGRGHAAVVNLLLASKRVNVESKDNLGSTPLLHAAQEGHEAVVKLLLAENAYSGSTDIGERTPLSHAAQLGHKAVVELLLANNVDPDSGDARKRTPISYAAEWGHEAVVKLLLSTKNVNLDSKAVSFDYNRIDHHGWTPLLYAIYRNHKTVVKLLLDAGASITLETRIWLDTHGGSHEDVLNLLGMSVELDVPVRLRRAILQNDVLLVKRIVKNNPSYLENPDFADKSNTSLHLAAIKGHVHVLKLLLSFGHDSCTPNINRTGYDSAPGISLNTESSTSLHLAASHSHAACVNHLCQTFPHIINWRDKNGKTALMLAAQSSNPTHTPLSTSHIPPTGRPRAVSAGTAMASEDTATVAALLAHNASMALTDNAGNTALHHASAWGNLKAVRVLLSAGAPPFARNKANHSPLDYSITKQAAQYFQTIVSELGKAVQEPKLKLNTAVSNVIASADESRSAGPRLSPIVSPVQARMNANREFAKAMAPSKGTPGGLRLVIDTENNELANLEDDDVPSTAKRLEREP